jgi:hypothetical protein
MSAGRLIVTGAETDACIRSTPHGAFARGYDVTLAGGHRRGELLTLGGLVGDRRRRARGRLTRP